MSGALRRILARTLLPVFLLAGLLTGGASLEGEFEQAIFFSVSGLLAAALFVGAQGWIRGGVATAFLFTLATVLILLAQLVPLPRAFVAGLPDRAAAFETLSILGLAPETLPLSLAPDATLGGLLAFLAPVAAFCLTAAIKWSRGADLLKWTLPLLAGASALLGLAQIFLGKANPALYLHDFTAPGQPVGFFANPNHQASFLLMGLPFVAVIAARLRRDWEGNDQDLALAALAICLALLLFTGILAAGSAAGYLLLVPVTLLSLIVAFSGRRKARSSHPAAWVLMPLILAAAAVAVFSSPRLTGLGQTSFEDGPGSRIAINRVSAEMAEVHWQAGTGLGSYEDVYRLYEDPDTVSNIYVAHAHNDYFEWIIETGVAGTLLLAAFLLWWFYHFGRLWIAAPPDALRLRRAGAIATLVPVLHSLVDYPLRTPGIASIAAVCLALMVVPRSRSEAPVQPSDPGTETLRTVTI